MKHHHNFSVLFVHQAFLAGTFIIFMVHCLRIASISDFFCSCCLADYGDHSYNTGIGLCNWNCLCISDSSILDLSSQRTCQK